MINNQGQKLSLGSTVIFFPCKYSPHTVCFHKHSRNKPLINFYNYSKKSTSEIIHIYTHILPSQEFLYRLRPTQAEKSLFVFFLLPFSLFNRIMNNKNAIKGLHFHTHPSFLSSCSRFLEYSRYIASLPFLLVFSNHVSYLPADHLSR